MTSQAAMADAYCIFCEDVRHEMEGRVSLIGVYKSSVKLPAFPHTMPKLGFYVNIRSIPQNRLPKTIKFQILADWADSPIVNFPIDDEAVEKLAEEHKKNKKGKGGIILSGVISPIEIPKPGRLQTRLQLGRTFFDSGALNFIKEEP